MEDGIIVHATRDQIEDFKESLLWKDITRELETWSEGFNLEMLSIVSDAETSNPSTATVLMHIGDLSGRQKAVDYLLGILDVFLGVLEDKAMDKEIEEVS